MFKRLFLGVVLTGLTTTSVKAESPFNIMDDHFNGLNTKIIQPKVHFFENYRISKQDLKRGFTATVIDPSKIIATHCIDDRPFVVHEIEAWTAKGQYVLKTFAVVFSREARSFDVKVEKRKNSSGNSIQAENIRVFRVIKKIQNKQFSGDFLIKPALRSVPASSVVYYAVLLYIPESAKAGLYTGNLKLKSEKGSLVMPVTIRALSYNLPDSGNSYGVFMPGHFKNNTGGKNWAVEFFNQQTLKDYFRFWKTRKMNSPTLYHVYPQMKNVAGKQEYDLSILRLFANTMKKCGLAGYLCLETRWFSWYADSVSKGDSEKAELIYSNLISKILATAKKENWPEIKLTPEEEIANRSGKKIETYRKYWPILRKIAKGKDYIIDNDIGFGRKNAVDRGHRDGFKVRQYNSWTEKAIENAKHDGAEVWTYNYGGFNRGNFGFLQQLLGSKANHQWADMWWGGKSSRSWIYCILTGEGVLSSIQYERVHEGINDFAYCHLLQTKIDDLKKNNLKQVYLPAEKVLDNIMKNVPTTGPGFRNWMKYTSDNELDLKRWRLALAVNSADKALQNNWILFKKGIEGKLKISAVDTKKMPINNSKILYLPLMEHDKIKLDGRMLEKSWLARNCTGALKIMGQKEAHLRAYSSSDEQFRKLSSVSYSCARVGYDDKGIWLGVICNHVNPSKNYIKSDRGDDDGDLWRDDCMEFFMKPINAKYYLHLIVNSRGKKVLMKNGKVISSKGIRIGSVWPINGSGGIGQEIFLPWRNLGVEKMPAAGTLWGFNVGREFHSWSQFTSWGRVYSSFNETEKWGQLLFTGKKANSLFNKIKLSSGLPGINWVKGEAKIPSNFLKTNLEFVLKSKQNTIARKKIPINTQKIVFKFDFNIPHLQNDQIWNLNIVDTTNDKIIGSLKIPAHAVAESIKIKTCPIYVISGQRLIMRITAAVSTLELQKHNMVGVIVNITSQRELSLPSVKLKHSGDNKLWIKTAGLPPGKYKIKLWIEGLGNPRKCSSGEFTVLHSPYEL